MGLLKRYFLLLFVMTLLFGISGWFYYDYTKQQESTLALQKYKQNAQEIRVRIGNALLLKEKSTLGIALSLSANRDLQKKLVQNKIPSHYYDELIKQYRKNTLYKNIWIQIIDKNGQSLYRSWTKRHGDLIIQVRNDLQLLEKLKKTTYSVSVGRYDLSIKAMVPIFYKEKFMGIIEVISHFNSIEKILQKEAIESVVLTTPEESKHLKYPFTKIFVQDYYVANFGAPKHLLSLLEKENMEEFFHKDFVLKDGYLIVDYKIEDVQKKVIGHYLAFEKLESIKNRELEHFQSTIALYLLIFLMAFAGVVNITLYYILRKQKLYYKNIIDASSNIVLVNDKKKILDANKTFFKYFKSYKNLEEFRAKNTCICNFFLEEEGYINKGDIAYGWLDYILEHSEDIHKVKMDIEGEIYYFSVDVALISEENEHYSVIFSDITHEEQQKRELERLSVRDHLTSAYNRRYYTEAIKKEMSNAKRYEYPLSLIMLDIDFFKKVNDTHGHGVGDEVLITYSKLIETTLRSSDIFCRVGGEEFIIVLPHTDLQAAEKIAQKLRVAVEDAHKILDITMSFGVTQYVYGEDESHLNARVDKALYKAKENGRNRVEIG